MESDRGNKDSIMLFIWKQTPMSKAGYKQWNPKLRAKISKMVYKPHMMIYNVSVEEISTEEKLANLINLYCGDSRPWCGENGAWIVRGCSLGKTKTHRKWVRIARIVIRRRGDKFSYSISCTGRLKRYWFWEGS